MVKKIIFLIFKMNFGMSKVHHNFLRFFTTVVLMIDGAVSTTF